jgi:alpha-tubulin suppressor-like RCC1 family protein
MPSLYAWGDNAWGQLGPGGASGGQIEPRPVAGVPTASLAVAAAGPSFGMGALPDGSVVGAGSNHFGQLALGSKDAMAHPGVYVLKPGSNVVRLVSGGFTVFAERADGSWLAWGYNADGQLGDGTTTDAASPVVVATPGTNVAALATSTNATLALLGDGTVIGVGNNSSGQLGDGTTTDRLSPVIVGGWTSGSGIIAVALGTFHGLALRDDGAVFGWGQNTYGQVGDGTNTDRLAPVAVAGLSTGSGVEGVAAGTWHSAVVKGGGSVWTWGRNHQGQLGIGSLVDSASPTASLQFGAGATHFATGLAARGDSTMARTSDPRLVAWGANSNGQLGVGTVGMPVLTPTPVLGLDDVVEFVLAATHCYAVADPVAAILPDPTFIGLLTPFHLRGVNFLPSEPVEVFLVDPAAPGGPVSQLLWSAFTDGQGAFASMVFMPGKGPVVNTTGPRTIRARGKFSHWSATYDVTIFS